MTKLSPMKNNKPQREISETKQSRKEAKKAQKLALKQQQTQKKIETASPLEIAA